MEERKAGQAAPQQRPVPEEDIRSVEQIKTERREPGKGRRVPGKMLEHWRVISLFIAAYDALTVNLAYYLALWFRFDCRVSAVPIQYADAFLHFVPVYTVFTVCVFWALRLYRSIWRFASYDELLKTVGASVITSVFHIVGITALFQRMPLSYYFFGMIFQFLFTLGIRFSYRLVLLERDRRRKSSFDSPESRVMLVGAGSAGQLVLRDIQRAREVQLRVCCIIDDNRNKWGRYIDGVPVVGGREGILLNVKKYNIGKIFMAIPSATAEEQRDILNICKETGCELKLLPGVYQMVNGDVSVSHMRDVAVEDLLGREPVQVDLEEIFGYLTGRRILVTGGGGSIGSELCRQIAGHKPAQLIIFDVYENNAYDIEQELRSDYPELNLEVLIGSVRDSRRINSVFETYRPEVVYHAAAHKHVPLMEASPCEAIKNNVIGTYKTARAALMNGCRRFVLISTDKAVNPTNIMGASKRLCEMVIQTMDRIAEEGRERELPPLYGHYDELETETTVREPLSDRPAVRYRTEFVAVRFGNVLGSNGSVIPLFRKQIAKGGPVTVTHPDIIRYFMTIPEAVSLVLQAGVYAKGGEIFVLDMGEPVKIDTLARNLIKLSGYKPDEDIKVVYTGLRPGEKLYEERLMAEEGLRTTRNHLIHIGNPVPFDERRFLEQLEELADASYNNSKDICEMVEEIVTTYHPEKKQRRCGCGVA